LDKKAIDKLKTWVRNGGILIGYRSAANWLKSNKFISLEFEKTKMDTIKDISFEDRSKQSGAQVIGGAIFEA
jgi:hypothetical protein